MTFSQEIIEHIVSFLPPKEIGNWISSGECHTSILNKLETAAKNIVLEKIAYQGKLISIPTKYFKNVRINVCAYISIQKGYIDQLDYIFPFITDYEKTLQYAITHKNVESIKAILKQYPTQLNGDYIPSLLNVLKEDVQPFLQKFDFVSNFIFPDRICYKLGEIGNIKLYQDFESYIPEHHHHHYALVSSEYFQNYEMSRYIQTKYNIQLYTNHEDLLLVLWNINDKCKNTDYLYDFLVRHVPSKDCLDDVLTRNLVFSDSTRIYLQYIYDYNRTDMFYIYSFLFNYLITSYGYTHDFALYLLSFITENIDINTIVKALERGGNIEIVTHLANLNRIDCTPEQLYILNLLLADDTSVVDNIYNILPIDENGLLSISFHCNLINIYKTFGVQCNGNPKNPSNEMIQYILDNSKIDIQLLGRFMFSKNLINFIDQFDTYLQTFLFCWSADMRPFIKSINVNNIWLWVHPSCLYIQSRNFLDNVNFNWLESQGFDFYGIPKEIVPDNENCPYRNIVLIYSLRSKNDSNKTFLELYLETNLKESIYSWTGMYNWSVVDKNTQVSLIDYLYK